ncbi:MAG: hypothetical protein J7K54_03370 [Candidatus Aenigmarchaeota archaeon]|nr:hypothetical protein [Candidatus Aenigmarchaeota archaeon]
MKRILVFSLMFIVLSSGCISEEQKNHEQTLAVFKSPESYLGENVTLYSGVMLNDSGIFNAYSEFREGDYTYMLLLNGTFRECGHCTIKGIVRKISLCGCEYASCSGDGCMPPENASWMPLGTRVSSECDGKAVVMALGSLIQRNVFRCSPGTSKEIYYLEATSVSGTEG